MASQTGRCVVWSVGSTTYTGAALVAGTTLTQKIEFTRRAETSKIKDENNDNVTRIDSNHGMEIAISVHPVAPTATNTGAQALAAATAWCPKIGTLITVIETTGLAKGTTSTGWTNAYCVASAKLSRSIDGAAIADLTLEQDDANNTTNLATG